LSDNGGETHAKGGVFAGALCQFTEPAVAGRSPDASVECEQDRAAGEIVIQRSDVTL
jgi:hypothetical protein